MVNTQATIYDPKTSIQSTPPLEKHTGSEKSPKMPGAPTTRPPVYPVMRNASFPGTHKPIFHTPPSSVRVSAPTHFTHYPHHPFHLHHPHHPHFFPLPVHSQPLHNPTIVPNYSASARPVNLLHPSTSQPPSTAAYLHYPMPSSQGGLLTLPASSALPHGVKRSPPYKQTAAPSSQNNNWRGKSAGLLPHPIEDHSQSLAMRSPTSGHRVHPYVQQQSTSNSRQVCEIFNPQRQSWASQERKDLSGNFKAQHSWKTN